MEWVLRDDEVAIYSSGAQVNADDCTVNPLQVAVGVEEYRFMIIQHVAPISVCHFARLNIHAKPLKEDTIRLLRQLSLRIFMSENGKSLFVPVEHMKLVDCIVRASLKLFYHVVVPPFKCTPRESRCFSMLCALLRQGSLPHQLVIQCLGAEAVECSSVANAWQAYEPFCKLLQMFGVNDLTLVFIGPSLLKNEPLQSMKLDSFTLTIAMYSTLYHEYVAEYPVSKIDLLICFNAGIWGYDSWLPTLQLLPQLDITEIIVTSFTMEEAEDDHDTIESILRTRVQWTMKPNVNPYRCSEQLQRFDDSAMNRVYMENNVWQAFKCE